MSSLIAGGSVEGGQAIGATDDKAQGQSIAASLPTTWRPRFRNIGIDSKTESQANVGRPITLIRDGQPIPGVLS